MPASAVLHYRHVNQAERYQKTAMAFLGNKGIATIPGDYTDTVYPLVYYAEIRNTNGTASLYPGFNRDLASQPYFVIHQTRL